MEGLLGPESDSLTVLAAWERWLRANYAENTVESYWGAVFRLLRRIPTPVTLLSEQDVAAFLESYPYRSVARRHSYQGLKSLFDWMEHHRLIVVNPISGYRPPPVHEKEPRALAGEEFEAVYQAAFKRGPHRAHAIALLYYTGGRLNEVLNLRWADVRSESLTLKVTKNGKERDIPMTAPLYEALSGLASRFGAEGRVIPRSAQTVWSWCRDAGRDAGIERVHPHLFRSSMVTDMLNAGVPVQVAARAVGHGNIKVTSRYAATRKEQTRDAFEQLRQLPPPA